MGRRTTKLKRETALSSSPPPPSSQELLSNSLGARGHLGGVACFLDDAFFPRPRHEATADRRCPARSCHSAGGGRRSSFAVVCVKAGPAHFCLLSGFFSLRRVVFRPTAGYCCKKRRRAVWAMSTPATACLRLDRASKNNTRAAGRRRTSQGNAMRWWSDPLLAWPLDCPTCPNFRSAAH